MGDLNSPSPLILAPLLKKGAPRSVFSFSITKGLRLDPSVLEEQVDFLPILI